MSVRRILFLALAWLGAVGASVALERRETAIGMPVRFTDVLVSGSELEALPCDARAPVCVRIVSSAPHGSLMRYELECTVLEPGEYQVRDFVRRRDGTLLGDMPALTLVARSALGAGQVLPATPRTGTLPRFGGYRTLAIVAALAWVAVLVWMLLAFRRRARVAAASSESRAATLAERLEGLVERARARTLSDAERRDLEMALVAHWRARLGLEELHSHELLPRLRAHPEAGPLLLGLERWLHAPGGAEDVDVATLLAPYQGLAAGAIDLPDAR